MQETIVTQENQDEERIVYLRLRDSVWRAAKIGALQRRITVRELVSDAINKFLESEKVA